MEKTIPLDSKTIAVVIVFTALTLVLNLSPAKIPAPYATFLIYEIWEIPIVAAFLLYGPKVGVSVAVINMLVLLIIFPGALPTGPIYNLVAILSMLSGIYVIQKTVTRRFSSNGGRINALMVAASTAGGTVMRVIVMSFLNFIVLPFPPPVGFSIPIDAAIAFLPVVGFFNATLALYTIPIGHTIAKVVSPSVRSTTAK